MFECSSEISNYTMDYCIGNSIVYSNKILPFGLTTTTMLLSGFVLIILFGVFILPKFFAKDEKQVK